MPFIFFTIGGGLIVLGFAFKVIQVTNRLTDVKNIEARKKLRNIGIISIITGCLVGVIALDMSANERNVLIVTAMDIAAIGVFTLIQYKLSPQNDKILGCAAYGVIILGSLLCLAYELVNIFG